MPPQIAIRGTVTDLAGTPPRLYSPRMADIWIPVTSATFHRTEKVPWHATNVIDTKQRRPTDSTR